MSEQQLLAAIVADPEADAPRLAFADWLTERGDPRGDFIRAHLEDEHAPLRFRRQLRDWTGDLAGLTFAHHRMFVRGFVENIILDAPKYLDAASRFPHPDFPLLRRLHLCVSAPQVASLVGSSLRAFTTLRLQNVRAGRYDWTEAEARAFADVDVSTIRRLELICAKNTGAFCTLLDAGWIALEELVCIDQPIGVAGARALASWDKAPAITLLEIRGGRLSASSLKELGSGPFQKLETLILRDNPKLTGQDALAFIEGHELAALSKLRLFLDEVSDDDVLRLHDAAEERGLAFDCGVDVDAVRSTFSAPDAGPHALIDAIRDDWLADEPRLVYADWLSDHGDPVRAEFIRLQLLPEAERDPDQTARFREIHARYAPVWCADLEALGQVPGGWPLVRGLVERSWLHEDAIDAAGHLIASDTFPLLDSIEFRSDRHSVARLAASPHLLRVRNLRLLNAARKRTVDGHAARALGESEYLDEIRTLFLDRTEIGPRALPDLLPEGRFSSLIGLQLPEHKNKGRSIKPLVGWTGHERLRWFGGLILDPKAAARLVDADWPALRYLAVRAKRGQELEVARILLDGLPELEALGVGALGDAPADTEIRDRGVRPLGRVRWLDLVNACR